MQDFQDSIQAQKEYATIYDRYVQNGRRLFITDRTGIFAAKSVRKIIEKENTPFLFVLNNPRFAESPDLFPSGEKISVYKTAADFRRALNELGTTSSVAACRLLARKFKEKNEKLVLLFKDCEGKSVLNAELCIDDTCSGSYGSKESHAPYCISDFLVDCNYPLFIAEGIYGFLSGIEEKKAETEYPPEFYERIDFSDNIYYADVAHSFKRLKNLASTKGCILISENFLDGRMVEFYLAQKLLEGEMNVSEVRQSAIKIMEAYEEDIWGFYDRVESCRTDEIVLNSCLHLWSKRPNEKFMGVDTIEKRIGNALSYMSIEEIGLRVIRYFQSGERRMSFDDMLDVFDNVDAPAAIANCLLSIFFNDEVKRSLEEKVSASYTCDMTAEEIESVHALYQGKGVIYTPKGGTPWWLATFYRDDSGFEYYVCREKGESPENVLTYTVCGEYTDEEFKFLMLKNLLTNKEQDVKLEYPVLVVKERILPKDMERFAEIFGEKVSDDYRSLFEKNEEKVVLANYDDVCGIPVLPTTGSVVLFDLTTNVDVLNKAAEKTSLRCSGEHVAFAGYSDLQGEIAEYILKNLEIFQGKFPPPVLHSMVKTENGVRCYSRDVLKKVNDVYAGFCQIASGRSGEQEAMGILQSFKKMLQDYTLVAAFSSQELKYDAAYLSRAGVLYGNIFANAMSVRFEGNTVVQTHFAEKKIEDRKALKKEKEAIKVLMKKKTTQDPTFEKQPMAVKKAVCKNILSEEKLKRMNRTVQTFQFFNVCIKAVRGECPITENGCNGCAEYLKGRVNDFAQFRSDIDVFYAFAKEEESRRRKEQAGGVIKGNEDNEGRKLVFEEIDQSEKKVNRLFLRMEAERQSQAAFFDTPYDIVCAILDEIRDIYVKILGKYLVQVREICKKTLNGVTNNYQIVQNGLHVHSGNAV